MRTCWRESFGDNVGESADRVIRVDIPSGDGTFTTLEGKKAQEWYDRAVAEEGD